MGLRGIAGVMCLDTVAVARTFSLGGALFSFGAADERVYALLGARVSSLTEGGCDYPQIGLDCSLRVAVYLCVYVDVMHPCTV